ncbi:MAG: hypothetical protein HFG72_12890 [Hungatella sp.]|nr:hypothetical protein [Hungatella sp.]
MKRQKKNRIPEEKLTGNPAQNPTENPAGEDYSVEDRALKEAARFLSVFSLLFVIFSGWSIWGKRRSRSFFWGKKMKYGILGESMVE